MIKNTMARGTKLSGLLRLFRFELPFTAGVCVLLGELLALGEVPTFYEMVVGFLSVFCISATSLILNDYFDIESDRINAPHRPLPAGLVTKRDVVLLSCAVTAPGFALGALISLQALLVILYSTLKLLRSSLPDRRKYIRWIYLSAALAMLIVIVIRMLR